VAFSLVLAGERAWQVYFYLCDDIRRTRDENTMSLKDLSKDQPFSYQASKSGAVQIAYKGRVVSKLSARDGAKFLLKVEAADFRQAQLLMAKATGHFKRGNERRVGDGH